MRATLADCTSACHHCHGVVDAPRAKGGRELERPEVGRASGGWRGV